MSNCDLTVLHGVQASKLSLNRRYVWREVLWTNNMTNNNILTSLATEKVLFIYLLLGTVERDQQVRDTWPHFRTESKNTLANQMDVN